jgi:hypothetical protein
MKNQYHLPLIQKLPNVLGKAKIYTKLDVRGAYNVLRAKVGDKYKLAFGTRYSLFEPTIMQLGTTNPLADFQGYIDNTIWEALDDYASAYLYDIMIYCDSAE